MLKLKKEKILVSLIAIVMIALVVGNVYSLATDGNNTGIQLTQNTANNATNTNKANTEADVGAEVGATNSNSSKNNTANTNKASNNAVNTSNTNTKNTNTNSVKSTLPYAGSNSSIIFIVIALGVSAAYAYKKVSDYNV